MSGSETYVRTVRFETPRLTAAKAGKINRAMKDYRRARELACRHFEEHGTDGFTLSDRGTLHKRINAHGRVTLSGRSIYPAITTVKQNYAEYEKDERSSPPTANRADTFGLAGQRTRMFAENETYYLVVHAGKEYVSLPLVTSDERYHSDRLPRPDAIPAKKGSRQRIPGTPFAALEPDDFPADTVSLRTSTLTKLDGDRHFRANLVFKIRKPISGAPSANDARYVVGVDRGRNELAYACLYDREVDTVVSWWNHSGDEVRHKMDGYADRIAEFQSAGVFDGMGSLRKRRLRYKRQLDYEIANKVVELARERFGCAIAIESLSGMSRLGNYATENRRFSSWSYYRLGEYIEQKASPYDIPIVEVDPAYTSVTCSRCGERGTTHRRGVHFECESCGYEQHADANASVNIAKAAAREAGETGEQSLKRLD
jgi:IS605 OrfB family transposase